MEALTLWLLGKEIKYPKKVCSCVAISQKFENIDDRHFLEQFYKTSELFFLTVLQ
jgi:hypothetical protein